MATTTLKNSYFEERSKRFESTEFFNADDLYFNDKELKKAASMLKAIVHPFRLKILQWLHREKESNVQRIVDDLKTPQPVVSLHLGILRSGKIVSRRQEGQHVIYSINYNTLGRLNKTINEHFHN